MKTKLFLLACWLISTTCVCQSTKVGLPGGNTYRDLNADNFAHRQRVLQLIKDMDENLPSNFRYSNSEFVDGTLFYIDGKRSGKKLNYYLLFGDVRMLENDDTLSIVNDPTLKYVRIGADFYYHDFNKGYFKVVDYSKSIKLVASHRLMLLNYSTYGNGNGTYSYNKKNVHSYYDSLSNPPFFQNEIIAANKKNFFHLLDNRGRVYTANLPGFLKAFPRYSLQIEGYVRQMARQGTRIKFYKSDDVAKLFAFIEGLQNINL